MCRGRDGMGERRLTGSKAVAGRFKGLGGFFFWREGVVWWESIGAGRVKVEIACSGIAEGATPIRA